MKVYAYYAADQEFGGLHGIETYGLMKTDSIKEVEEVARNESVNIIESFGCITDILIANAWEATDREDFYEEWDGLELPDDVAENYAELVREDIYYRVWEVKTEVVEAMSFDDLNELADEDFFEFISRHCIEVNDH